MDRPPHTPPPSAMDGFRRLERTRTQPPTEPQPRARRRRISARLTGALRMAGFVSVVALIVGTSVSLALTDPQETAQTKVREEAPAPVTHTVERTEVAAEPVATPRAAEPKPAAEPAPATEPVRAAAAPEPAAVPAEPAPAASVPAHRALPMTGPSVLQYALLGGAGLVLLGMLVQIAGQPLPASSCTRRASRLT